MHLTPTCARCHQTLTSTSARTLPCLHSHCLACLQTGLPRLFSSQPQCPCCCADFVLPAGGAAALPVDPFVLSRIRLQESAVEIDPNDVQCDCGEEPPAVYCQPCFYGERCLRVHSRSPRTAGDVVISVADYFNGVGGVAPMMRLVGMCPTHPAYEVDTFCRTDQTAMCAACAIPEHVAHRVVKLDDVSEEFAAEMLTRVPAATDGIRRHQLVLEHLQGDSDEAARNLRSSFARLRVAIEHREADLLDQVEAIRTQREKELRLEKEGLEFFEAGVEPLGLREELLEVCLEAVRALHLGQFALGMQDQDISQHLYMNVRLVTPSIAKHHHVTDLCRFETKTETPASALNLRVKKEMLYKDFKLLVAEKTGVPVAKQRHWVMAKRQNGTIRPDELMDRWDAEQIGLIRDHLELTVELKVFVEESAVEGDAGPFFEPFNPDSDILLFVKAYDPKRALLEFEAPYQMKLSDRPVDLIAKINARNGRPAAHPLKLYEEVHPTMVEEITSMNTFPQLEIGMGDIVCYCDDLSADDMKNLDLPSPPAYYERVLNSISVTFRDRNAPKDLTKQFSLLLSKKMSYDQVAALVAKHLAAEPLYLRFVSHNHYTEGPKLEFRYEPEKLLEEMLQPNSYQQMSDILYYEKLDISIKELENKRLIAVAWVSPKLTEEGINKLLCNKTDNIEQLLELMKLKVKAASASATTPAASPVPSPQAAPSTAAEPEPAGSGQLRLVEVINNRISKVFMHDEPVRAVYEYSPLYAEEIPQDQLQLGDGDQLVSCFRYHEDPYAPHGIPFLFVVRANEPWDKTSQRLRQRMRVAEKEFEKFKFSFVSFGRNKPITDPNAMLSETKFGANDHLGIDTPDRRIVFKN